MTSAGWMPMPAKRIHALLPVPSSWPKMTSATSRSTLMTHSSFHWEPRMSASIKVSTMKAPMPRNMEKVCTAIYFEGADMFQPPLTMPTTALLIITMPKIEQIVQITRRKTSARWKNCLKKGLSVLMCGASFPEQP